MSRIVNVLVGKPRRDRKGRDGVAVHLHIESAGWDGYYRFSTAGMLPVDVAAAKQRAADRHDRKAAKLTDLQSLVGTKLPDGSTVTDATVHDVGLDDCELHCRTSSGIELRQHYDDPARIPATASVLAMIRQMATAAKADAVGAEQHAADVRKALGL